MKQIRTLIAGIIGVAILTFSSPVKAAEVKYVGTLTGIECAACKKTIGSSLAKLGGIKTIRIIKGKGSSHRLEVITNGTRSISMADAKKALKKAEHYKITSWKKS